MSTKQEEPERLSRGRRGITQGARMEVGLQEVGVGRIEGLSPQAKTAKLIRGIAKAYERNPKPWMMLLPGQAAYIADKSRLKLYRAGNQHSGKTTAGLFEIVSLCEGTHPFLKRLKPPLHGWVVASSAKQSVDIQLKLFALLDKARVDWSVTLKPTEKQGFGVQNPVIKFKNGSSIKFRTSQQDPKDMAGATLNFVMIDEPVNERLFNELKKRVMRKGGYLYLTCTPIGVADLGYLRTMVDNGIVSDHHRPMLPSNLIPIGSRYPMRLEDESKTWMDADFIARERRETSPRLAPIILDGEWEEALGASYFPAFERHQIVVPDLADLWDVRKTWRVYLGIDHGTDFKQCAALVAVEGHVPIGQERIVIIGEYFGSNGCTPKDDAQGILQMMMACGVSWVDLDGATGDRAHNMSRFGGVNKNNIELHRHLRSILGVDKLHPAIWQAKTGVGSNAGSVQIGVDYLHRRMVNKMFYILERCVKTAESFEKWNGSTRADEKDIIDATRYATWQYAFDQVRRQNVRLKST